MNQIPSVGSKFTGTKSASIALRAFCVAVVLLAITPHFQAWLEEEKIEEVSQALADAKRHVEEGEQLIRYVERERKYGQLKSVDEQSQSALFASHAMWSSKAADLASEVASLSMRQIGPVRPWILYVPVVSAPLLVAEEGGLLYSLDAYRSTLAWTALAVVCLALALIGYWFARWWGGGAMLAFTVLYAARVIYDIEMFSDFAEGAPLVVGVINLAILLLCLAPSILLPRRGAPA